VSGKIVVLTGGVGGAKLALGLRQVVAPIVGGKAVKGLKAKFMLEPGIPVTARAIADHYRGVIDGLLVDERMALKVSGSQWHRPTH
jgi:2-phospho-L-lactate transferase/gluconeogenesis factor (CofD/UPF0052 family)